MSNGSVVRTVCKLCQSGCGMLVHMKDGRPEWVEGDPEYPINKGNLCAKGKAALEFLNSPYRLRYPMKRVGERGTGKWQQISWDEALDTVAFEMKKLKDNYGAETVVFIRGWAKGYIDFLIVRFANLFGSPNMLPTAEVCRIPRTEADIVTYGMGLLPDYDSEPACIVLWGYNPYYTTMPDQLLCERALANDARLIVIDPAEIEATKKSDIWIRPRPGTDLALALGMLNVIINEDLYDKEFVAGWTSGFDQLKEHVQQYSPEKVAEITWVPSLDIIRAARLYATHKPGIIMAGNALENTVNNFQSLRAVALLRSIVGNIGIPGGEISFSPLGIMPRGSADLLLNDKMTPDVLTRNLTAKDGFIRKGNYTTSKAVKDAIFNWDPYQVRGAFIQGANPVLTWSNTNSTLKAFNELEFIVVSDMFMTPTAELADIVLPVASFLEIDMVSESQNAPAVGPTRKIAQVGEAWSDYKIYAELAKRLAMGDYFPEEKDFMDFLLKPSGLTFDEFKRAKVFEGAKQYRIYKKVNFRTPSGKVELFSKKLQDQGFDPLPTYYEPEESSCGQFQSASEYPFVLTNRKYAEYTHAAYRQIDALRNDNPEPRVNISTQTAFELGISNGDWVYIENEKGRIKQKAALMEGIDPRVVIADFGWWYPEKAASDDLHGARESNYNILTDDQKPFGRELGSPHLKGIACKIYKV